MAGQKLVAVVGMTLDCTENGTAIPASSPSTKFKPEGKGAYLQGVIIAVTGASKDSCSGASGAGSMPVASKTKCQVWNSSVMTEGDEVTINVIGLEPDAQTVCNFTVDVEITDANQTKVKTDTE
jgi:hypothetical protein